MPLWATTNSYRVPGLRGQHCSISCMETVLFGQQHCRWCGKELEKPYTDIASRLCSRNCAANYSAQVMGDRSAALGSGTRLLLWLQRNNPAIYRKLTDTPLQYGKFCKNPDCTRGEDGQPGALDHLRNGSRFCCTECRVQAHRLHKAS